LCYCYKSSVQNPVSLVLNVNIQAHRAPYFSTRITTGNMLRFGCYGMPQTNQDHHAAKSALAPLATSTLSSVVIETFEINTQKLPSFNALHGRSLSY
jgi:hypothetical protein